ncbi:MAG TPA: hypothetical protein VK146_12470 [Tabrizicola sp.]|nr:hypothetical protein [Tabrizicola sp.]
MSADAQAFVSSSGLAPSSSASGALRPPNPPEDIWSQVKGMGQERSGGAVDRSAGFKEDGAMKQEVDRPLQAALRELGYVRVTGNVLRAP